MGKDKKPEELQEATSKIAEALKECSNTDVLYLLAEIGTFCCMSKAETLTDALDYWDSFHTAGRNHIKRTFGRAYEFMERQKRRHSSDKIDQASLQRAIDNPPPNTKME
jgi:hypothetical protein